MEFFGINAAGHACVRGEANELDLYELSLDLKDRGIGFPVLVRFPHVLQQMLGRLYTAFHQAIASCNYAGTYAAAYPVKVNQQASVIRYFHQQDHWPVAFEVGSKAELVACLGILHTGSRTIICNGCKDKAYIRLALTGRLLGHDVVIVLESLDEFQHVFQLSAQMKVEPALGMRVRLSVTAQGKWQNTGGERSKFGLTPVEILRLLEELQGNAVSGWMRMLHFHMGSQVSSLQHIRACIEEGVSYFAELYRLGIEFTQLNVGGGLAVDYEGSQSSSYFSMDYSVDEYARSVVSIVHSICQSREVPAPTLFTESGRAMTAYHAVLLTNVVEAEYLQGDIPGPVPGPANEKLMGLDAVCQQIRSNTTRRDNTTRHASQYAELMRAVRQVNRAFSCAEISLAEKAYAETLELDACQWLFRSGECLDDSWRSELEERLVDKYFCNFSLFQSIPDAWGLNQVFPILPLHRLDEAPTRHVRLHDLTCDSDGAIERYVEADSLKPYLSLHALEPGQDYLIGVFLTGAYQEILGDMHNLFGNTCAVNVEVGPEEYRICEQTPGDTIEEVLAYVHVSAEEIRRTWHARLAQLDLPRTLGTQTLQALEAALQAGCYLDPGKSGKHRRSA